MKYRIDKNISTAAYLQLYNQLRNDIADGFYPYGSKLPSKRMISVETQVSVITVEHAYAILCDEGYIEARERSGYFVIYKKNDGFLASPDYTEMPGGLTDSETRNDTHNDIFGFPFSSMAKTMRKVISDYGERILVKSPNTGCIELRQAIASYLARNRGIVVKPAQIIIGSGAEYIYSLIVQFLGRNRIFAVENPSYEKILRVYRANGVKCDKLKLGIDGILTRELMRTQATVLHVTPFKSYPSGITASPAKRAEYVEWAAARSGYIIEDDFSSEFTISTKAFDTVFSPKSYNRVIYLNTFSQTIAPAMRVGYMVLPEDLIELYEERTGFYSCTVPTFEQYVLAEFINSGEFERHINRVRRKIRNSSMK